jgi:hypothetical protein
MRACCVAQRVVFLVASKLSEVGRLRCGSNPARQNLEEKPIQGAPRFSPHHTLDPINYCPNAVPNPDLLAP